MTLDEYLYYRSRIVELDAEAFIRAGSKTPPSDATAFALRVAYVILNSGMKWSVSQLIWERLRASLTETGSVGDAFKHPGKRDAIDRMMRERVVKFEEFQAAWCDGPDAVIAFCSTLEFIGAVTKFHLAKNLGVDCAKPDVWLERVAKSGGETVETMCRRLSEGSGDRVATVDFVIWKSGERGLWYVGSRKM